MERETPMMEQFHRIKKEHADSILLFRLGDFYEMFEEDALTASPILGITLTRRNDVPMCGFPYHASDAYIAKLIKEGKKVAICEQREDPAVARGIVKREVIEIISPGIILDPGLLKNTRNNCIAAVYGAQKPPSGASKTPRLACASLDVSTGEFTANVFDGGDMLDAFLNEVEENGIREVLYPEFFAGTGALERLLGKVKVLKPALFFRAVPDSLFGRREASEALRRQFSVANEAVLELRDESEVLACGALLAYVKENVRQEIAHIRWVREKRPADMMVVDNATKKHLELTESQLDGGEGATLFSVLDRTATAMGGRLLRRLVNSPSGNLETIRMRLEKVGCFVRNAGPLEKTRRLLARIMDIERLLSKLTVGKGNARDLIGVKTSLEAAAGLKRELGGEGAFSAELGGIEDFSSIVSEIGRSIVEDPPASVREGGVVRRGYSGKLDEFRDLSAENREWINRYQVDEQRKTGISSLKVRYNRIIGYYIEVTKPNIHLVPPSFVRKQTLVGSERFTTEELEKHETLLLEARESANELEYGIFEEIRGRVLDSTRDIARAAGSVALLDVYASLALAALENGYVKPELVEENVVEITGGRHPVIERFGEERFIENDLFLNDSDRRIMILTGPNMAGKSTYLRQCALIVIMAHMGSFVPARSARIGLVDRLFSRIGMSDRLVKGESTFLVEMVETSRILHYATNRSFVIMDEIGRGTSTYDGLAIAWAVLEHLLDEKLAGAKVLFATHYHEITALGGSHGVINCNATVREWNGSVVFLRKIVPGSASKSYGIEVARMAGIPAPLIERAKAILALLEASNGSCTPLLAEGGAGEPVAGSPGERAGGEGRSAEAGASSGGDRTARPAQLALFPSPSDILLHELKNLDIDAITPIEALNILERLKRSLLY
jgi:DNA mismatch repair protein MutS